MISDLKYTLRQLAKHPGFTGYKAGQLTSLDQRISDRVGALPGVLALALACVGLYGLMCYAVLRRTSEIGIRMALGALLSRVLGMILRESLALVGTGVIIGLAAAAAATRLMSHLLFGLSPTDPVTFAGGALLLIVVAVLACLVPARRAAQVDPVVALRAE